MSLKYTHNTQHWNSIPKKCKNCSKAIYTKEKKEIYYQCSLFGKFKRECDVETESRILDKPEEILAKSETK
jgi:acetyl-CoA carboxylase beta subunit